MDKLLSQRVLKSSRKSSLRMLQKRPRRRKPKLRSLCLKLTRRSHKKLMILKFRSRRKR